MPAPHAEQEVELDKPRMLEYLPVTQPTQAVEALAVWYEPAAHGVHAEAPATPKLPPPQATQTVDEAAPVTMAYLPAAQALQESDPVLRSDQNINIMMFTCFTVDMRIVY